MCCDRKHCCIRLARTGYPGDWHVRMLMGVELDVLWLLLWLCLTPWKTIFRRLWLLRITTYQFFPFLPASFFCLLGLSSRLPRLSLSLPSSSLSSGSGVPPVARCIVGGGSPPPPPPAPALCSGVGFERFPFTRLSKEVTASVYSAICLSCLSLASLFASNSAIIALSMRSWSCRCC